MTTLYQHKVSPAKTDEAVLNDYKAKFNEAIDDDLNIPLALGVLFNMLKEPKSKDVYDLALQFDKVFGLSFDKVTAPKQESQNSDIPQEVLDLVQKRADAKKAKDFALADAIRGQIAELGYNVKDTREGAVITKQ